MPKHSYLIATFLFATALTSQAAPIREQDVQDSASNQFKARFIQRSPRSVTLKRKGAGKNNVVQGIAIDEKRNIFYTAHVTGTPQKGVINRFELTKNSNQLLEAQDAQKASPIIGHQGITVDPRSGKLVASAGPEVINLGWHVVQFVYTANHLPSSQVIQVFGEGYSKRTNTMPSFTPDGKYLVVRGKKGKSNIIRVYSGDYLQSNHQLDYLYEWPVDKKLTENGYPFQAMTTDGHYVYLLSGNSNLTQLKRLLIYTLKGKLIQTLDQINLGQNDAKNISPNSIWEPEGLTVNSKDHQLYIFYAVGKPGQRLGKIYKINIH